MLALGGLASLAAGLHEAVRRTLVPTALDTRLADKARRTEHVPGLDDVVLWTLEDGRSLRVTDQVDELAARGARVRKDAGERTLWVDGEARALPWSDDVKGFGRAAGPAALVLLGLAVAAARRRPAAPPRTPAPPTASPPIPSSSTPSPSAPSGG